MLSYALAIAVAISSLVIFSTAFLMSKIHRQDDFLWSGVGLFYALVLWYCARNITGAVLLGQAAATVLVVSYSWQTIKLRRIIANPASVNENTNFSLLNKIKGLIKRQKPQVASTATPVVKEPPAVVTEENITIPDTPTESTATTPEKTTDNNISTTSSEVQLPDAQSELEEKESITPDAQSASEKQVSQPLTNESQSLPNKLPDVVDEAPKESEKIEQPTPEVTATTTTSNSEESEKIEQPTPEVTTTATKEINTAATASHSTPTNSQFDKLETVEVAEVLEAESDYDPNKNNLEQSNIIEVTTTEIDTTPEVQKTDQNQ